MYRFYATENMNGAEKADPSQRDIQWEDYNDEKVINQSIFQTSIPGFLRSLMCK